METQSLKAQLTNQLGEEHEQLESMLSELSAEQWNEPGVCGEWSIKDILAHIIAYEQIVLQELELALRGEPIASEYRDLETFNQRVVQDYRSIPIDEVQKWWDQSYKKVLSAVYQLKEDDFSQTSPVAKAIGGSISKIVGKKTYEHYAEHRIQIERWLASSHSPD